MARWKQLSATASHDVKNKRGFTLVELSIVLLIIGLLIGGILIARDMISTARNQSFIRQVQQFDIGVGTFQARFGSLPGDAETFGGDGNSVIEDGTGAYDGGQSIAVQSFSDEMANFWKHLQLSGFSGEGKTYTETVGVNGFSTGLAQANSPKSNLGKDAGVIASNCSSNGILANCYTFANWEGLASGFVVQDTAKAAFTVAEALAVDTKIDDGKPQSGNVQNRMMVFLSVNYATSLDCDNMEDVLNYTAAVYSTSSSGNVCFLAIGMGGQILGNAYNP